jgi:ketopantoate hydroxymethyltransferase
MTSIDVPGMRHIGLLPQREAFALSVYRVQDKDAAAASEFLRNAQASWDAGPFAQAI